MFLTWNQLGFGGCDRLNVPLEPQDLELTASK